MSPYNKIKHSIRDTSCFGTELLGSLYLMDG